MKVAIIKKNKTKTKIPKTEISYLGGKSIEETYQDKELKQQIFDCPDTFVGSIESIKELTWIFNNESGLMEQKELDVIEAFVKIFDEVLVNAIDQHHRIKDKIKANPKIKSKVNQVKNISVDIDRKNGEISILNDGEGIDITIHPKNKKYVPEMLFGDLLSSGNYDKDEVRTVGGRNGFGAKLANIFSTKFYVETVDAHRKLKFVQEYRNNMSEWDEPKITKYNGKPYTKVVWTPDFNRFGIDLEKAEFNDNWDIITRRVYDTSACTDRSLNVHLNGNKIKTKDFEDYICLFIGKKGEFKRVFSKVNERWEVGVCLSPTGKFKQISFVNGIFTDRGGRHVRHIVDNLCKKLAETINNKTSKTATEIKSAVIKENIWVFVKSTINNPSFDTQTKRCLTTLVSKFGSRCNLTEEFVKKIARIGIEKRAKELANFRAKTRLGKKTDGSKKLTINDSKIVDARFAGGRNSSKCIFVLTEGDSAAGLVRAGIKALADNEQKYWGWLPLRGKLLNVQKATVKQLSKNTEISSIKKAVGLKEGENYSKSITSLRYGKIMILTDADKDGDHIKGLIMNFIYTYWPSLIKRNNFICSFSTPILKAWPKGTKKVCGIPDPKKTVEFYSEKKYAEWREGHMSGWDIKYFKGLGTFTAPECKDSFKKMFTTHYVCDDDPYELANGTVVNSTDYHINLAFSDIDNFKSARKKWVDTEDALIFEPDHKAKKIKIRDFINGRLIKFSKSDVVRSIPNVLDGLKPSQRKILYACFKKKLIKDIKVEQFQGYISENTSYHHGGVSLTQAIVKMAQDFTGSNNMSLLFPSGNYGSRALKGIDAAQPRYIFTRLTEIAKEIYNPNDLPLMNYLKEENRQIEPFWYLPVIPMLLVNGSEGIGTGYSTTIPSYNPLDIIQNLRAKLKGEPMIEMAPWYRGFGGKIKKLSNQKYIVLGRYNRTSKNSVRLMELPVGTKKCKSFTDYKMFLLNLMENSTSLGRSRKKSNDTSSVKSRTFKENVITNIETIKETDTDLVIEIIFKDGVLDKELKLNETKEYNFEKKMHFASLLSTTNMHAFDRNGKIKKYESELDIIDDFFLVRLEYYEKRYNYIISDLAHKLGKVSSKFRFLTEIMDDVISIYRIEEKAALSILDGTAEKGAADPPYPKYTIKSDDPPETANYNYLLSIPVRGFTKSHLEKLKKEIDTLTKSLENIKAKTYQQLWIEDLDSIEKLYKHEVEEWDDRYGYVERKTVTLKKKKLPFKMGKSIRAKKAKKANKKKTTISIKKL